MTGIKKKRTWKKKLLAISVLALIFITAITGCKGNLGQTAYLKPYEASKSEEDILKLFQDVGGENILEFKAPAKTHTMKIAAKRLKSDGTFESIAENKISFSNKDREGKFLFRQDINNETANEIICAVQMTGIVTELCFPLPDDVKGDMVSTSSPGEKLEIKKGKEIPVYCTNFTDKQSVNALILGSYDLEGDNKDRYQEGVETIIFSIKFV